MKPRCTWLNTACSLPGGVPGISQAINGLESGLSSLPGGIGSSGSQARDAIKKMGVKGLDAGFGCGVGIGYGFGAGLMFKPSALEKWTTKVKQTAGNKNESYCE